MLRVLALTLSLWVAVTAQGPRPWLGVGLIEVPAELAERLQLGEAPGAVIAHVAPGSPADRAGLRQGEVIARFNDRPVPGIRELGRMVAEATVGQAIPVEIATSSGRRTVDVTLEAAQPPAAPRGPGSPGAFETPHPPAGVSPPDFDIPRPIIAVRNRALGVMVEPLEGQLAEYFGVAHGLLVREVRAGSAGAEAGLSAGDVIVEAAGRQVRHPEQLRSALARRAADEAELAVVRSGKRLTLKLKLEGGGPFSPRPPQEP
jgi:serine protease Do